MGEDGDDAGTDVDVFAAKGCGETGFFVRGEAAVCVAVDFIVVARREDWFLRHFRNAVVSPC